MKKDYYKTLLLYGSSAICSHNPVKYEDTQFPTQGSLSQVFTIFDRQELIKEIKKVSSRSSEGNHIPYIRPGFHLINRNQQGKEQSRKYFSTENNNFKLYNKQL